VNEVGKVRVMITGGAGFLGQAVGAALMKEGHIVVGMDNNPTPILTFVEWYNVDITEKLHPTEYGGNLDAVIHMAAIAAPRTCDADPGLAYNVNVNGTHQVLKLAVASGAKKFVFISSAHVYGISPKYLPTDERHPLQPQETYTTTKILGEKLCELYHENYGLSYTTLRLFNAYGPGQLPGYFIPDQLLKAQAGSINLGGGDITKDFVYIDDVVQAILAALETDYIGPINIGTGVQSSLRSVSWFIAHELGAEFSETFSSDAHPTVMECDWSRAKSILGWSPTVSIQDGLLNIISQGHFLRAASSVSNSS